MEQYRLNPPKVFPVTVTWGRDDYPLGKVSHVSVKRKAMLVKTVCLIHATLGMT